MPATPSRNLAEAQPRGLRQRCQREKGSFHSQGRDANTALLNTQQGMAGKRLHSDRLPQPLARRGCASKEAEMDLGHMEVAAGRGHRFSGETGSSSTGSDVGCGGEWTPHLSAALALYYLLSCLLKKPLCALQHSWWPGPRKGDGWCRA